jgi:hypothetical protein
MLLWVVISNRLLAWPILRMRKLCKNCNDDIIILNEKMEAMSVIALWMKPIDPPKNRGGMVILWFTSKSDNFGAEHYEITSESNESSSSS